MGGFSAVTERVLFLTFGRFSSFASGSLHSQSNGKVEAKQSPCGSAGVFALCDFSPGDVIFNVPREFIISSGTDRMRKHPIVSALMAADNDIALETLLFTYIVLEQGSDSEYLASLPTPTTLNAEELSGTNVGAQILKDEAELASQLKHIHAAGGSCGKGVTLIQLSAAKAVYNSRRLLGIDTGNKRKAGDDEPTRREHDHSQGSLVPLLDLLNHGKPSQLDFDVSDPLILKIKTKIGLSKGAEIFNDYGCINNDQLLLQFGFCDRAMPSIFTVVLPGGQRFDLSSSENLPPILVVDKGRGLKQHLGRKLAQMEGAKISSNTEVLWFMEDQKILVRTLISRCDTLNKSLDDSPEPSEGESDDEGDTHHGRDCE